MPLNDHSDLLVDDAWGPTKDLYTPRSIKVWDEEKERVGWPKEKPTSGSDSHVEKQSQMALKYAWPTTEIL